MYKWKVGRPYVRWGDVAIMIVLPVVARANLLFVVKCLTFLALLLWIFCFVFCVCPCFFLWVFLSFPWICGWSWEKIAAQKQGGSGSHRSIWYGALKTLQNVGCLTIKALKMLQNVGFLNINALKMLQNIFWTCSNVAFLNINALKELQNGFLSFFEHAATFGQTQFRIKPLIQKSTLMRFWFERRFPIGIGGHNHDLEARQGTEDQEKGTRFWIRVPTQLFTNTIPNQNPEVNWRRFWIGMWPEFKTEDVSPWNRHWNLIYKLVGSSLKTQDMILNRRGSGMAIQNQNGKLFPPFITSMIQNHNLKICGPNTDWHEWSESKGDSESKRGKSHYLRSELHVHWADSESNPWSQLKAILNRNVARFQKQRTKTSPKTRMLWAEKRFRIETWQKPRPQIKKTRPIPMPKAIRDFDSESQPPTPHCSLIRFRIKPLKSPQSQKTRPVPMPKAIHHFDCESQPPTPNCSLIRFRIKPLKSPQSQKTRPTPIRIKPLKSPQSQKAKPIPMPKAIRHFDSESQPQTPNCSPIRFRIETSDVNCRRFWGEKRFPIERGGQSHDFRARNTRRFQPLPWPFSFFWKERVKTTRTQRLAFRKRTSKHLWNEGKMFKKQGVPHKKNKDFQNNKEKGQGKATHHFDSESECRFGIVHQHDSESNPWSQLKAILNRNVARVPKQRTKT